MFGVLVPATRFRAAPDNTTRLPSPEIPPALMKASAGSLAFETLTRSVVPAERSVTKTSRRPELDPGRMFDAVVSKSAVSPFALRSMSVIGAFGAAASLVTSTSRVASVVRSRRKRLKPEGVGPDTTRFVASDVNSTNRPSPLVELAQARPFGFPPLAATEIRSVVSARWSRT